MSDELRECPECGTTNNLFVNPERCYDCGVPWSENFIGWTFTGP